MRKPTTSTNLPATTRPAHPGARQAPGTESIGNVSTGNVSTGAVSTGAVSIGAVPIGAVLIGAVLTAALIGSLALPGQALAAARQPDTTDVEDLGAYLWPEQPAGAIVLTLEQALEHALHDNLQVLSARKDWESAQTGELNARGAFDPVLNLFGFHDKSVTPQSVVPGLDVPISQNVTDGWTSSFQQKLYYGATYEIELNGSRRETNNTFTAVPVTFNIDAVMRFTQPLLRGLGRDANMNEVLKAVNNGSLAKDTYLIRARDIIKSAIDAYWDLVFRIQDLEVKRKTLELAQELLRKNRIMVEVGTLAPLEVVQSEASVAERRQQTMLAEKDLGDAGDVLRRLMGVPEDSTWWDAPLVPAERPEFHARYVELDSAITDALSQRLELRSAGLRIENSQIDLDFTKDALQPNLDFQVSITERGLTGSTGDPDYDEVVNQLVDREFISYRASLNYRKPVFNRSAKATFTSARLDLESQRIALLEARQSIILEVRAAVRSLEHAREQVIASRATRRLNSKKLDAEIKKFENGLSTNFEVLQFQTDLSESASTELLAVVSHEKALAAVRKARGALLSEGEMRDLE